MTDIVKQEETAGFIIPKNVVNEAAVQKVQQYLPELAEKTAAFGSNNSQSTLAMMSLTMLCGHSPYRMLRQILAEAEKRKGALASAQVSYAKALKRIEELKDSDDPIKQARYREAIVNLATMEQKINGSFGDLATLIEAYNNIKEKNGITDWDEEAFEAEEKKHHVRRAFELMYRNLLDGGKMSTSTIEYCQQFGIHPQICMTETSGYVSYTAKRISEGEILHSNDLEEFLDEMADKYYKNADKTAERLFGKADFTVSDYMYKTVTK